MQLLAIALYNRVGDRRTVEFRPGRLNIVTGQSAAGKSTLLTIVDFCLGRDTLRVPVGPISRTVSWYSILVQLDGGKAFIARPAPAAGKSSTQQAMLEFGTDLELLTWDQLAVNADTTSLREQLGRRIGIEENLYEPPAGSLRSAVEANLGHAALYSFQGQSEIADSDRLFHRQGESGIEQALKDTFPYFVGAVPRDQALKRAQLRDARRQLQRVESALNAAIAADETAEVELVGLAQEAYAAGLTSRPASNDRLELTRMLEAALVANGQRSGENLDIREVERRRELDRSREALVYALRSVNAERTLLLEQRDNEEEYENSIGTQVSRLRSLNLLSPTSAGEESCPICRSNLNEPDTAASEIRQSLEELNSELEGIDSARPSKRAAIQRLDERAVSLRDEIRAVDLAIRAIDGTDRVLDDGSGEARVNFVRGRIDAILARLRRSSEEEIGRLRQQFETLSNTVSALEVELDDEEVRRQLASRLASVGDDMTRWAAELDLEHPEGRVSLDLSRLTVVTDTETGPAPLFRVGSAENWIGYNLVAHLALHRFFVRQSRPTLRFLMIDQPTQGYYPSEAAQESGLPARDADRIAVSRLFELMHRVVTELAGSFQVIVCDHANLRDDWFQESVEHNWRDEKLIPTEWIEQILDN